MYVLLLVCNCKCVVSSESVVLGCHEEVCLIVGVCLYYFKRFGIIVSVKVGLSMNAYYIDRSINKNADLTFVKSIHF